jgi:hypothetical protein
VVRVVPHGWRVIAGFRVALVGRPSSSMADEGRQRRGRGDRQGDGRSSPTVQRTWPPASTACTTKTPQPASRAASASSTEPTCQPTGAPPPWAASHQQSVRLTPEELDERTPGGRVLQRIAIEKRNQETHPE